MEKIMPEGPEIRIAADKVAKALVGQEATKLFFAFDHLKPYEEKLTGEIISRVEARGKAVLIHFANGLNIFSHNQLYGRWMVEPAGSCPNTNRQLRLAIHTQRKSALLFSASDIEVLRDEDLDQHAYLGKLGPDVLDEKVTAMQVMDRLLHKQFFRRKLGSLLLDQQFLAGLGNYLRSEVLFAARLHPALRPVDCSQEQIKRLAIAAVEVPRQSYQTRGITNDPELVKQLREAGHSRSQYRFRVFNRVDQPCYVCGTSIVKKEVGSRRLYFCPSCQKIEQEGEESDG